MEYLTEIATFFLGLVSGYALKVVIDRSQNTTNISNNKIGGDVAGRDLHKK